MNEPWICPKCNTVYAPWMMKCTCSYRYTPSIFPEPSPCNKCYAVLGHKPNCEYIGNKS